MFACAYIRRDLLQAIGGLALDYESYLEDTDYCLRAKEAGYATVVCGDVTLIHDEHGSTQNAEGELMRLFGQSQKVFRAKWEARLTAQYRHELLWQSIMNFPTGYAMSCREILRGLEQEGGTDHLSLRLRRAIPFPIPEPEQSGDYRLNVIAQRKPPRRPKVAVVYGQGDVFHRNAGRYKIGYTMLEVDGFPAEWVRQANQMDEIWVPTQFNRDGMLASGVKRPVHVVQLGTDTNFFNPGIRAFPNPDGEFVFLSIFEWGERKEPWLLLRAFNETSPRASRCACCAKSSTGTAACASDRRSANWRSTRLAARFRGCSTSSSLTISWARCTGRPTAFSRRAAARVGTCR